MMWRWSCIFLKQSLSSAVGYKPKAKAALGLRVVCASFSTESGGGGSGGDAVGGGGDNNNSSMSFAEAKKLMRLVNVEALKMKLGGEEKEVICYSELLQACESMGVAKSRHEAAAFARVLDEAGVVLLFRDKVYLHPDKVLLSLFLSKFVCLLVTKVWGNHAFHF
ncbi:hypothetical protein CsSME_00016035 [Camellia sinensis var. sinensis]